MPDKVKRVILLVSFIVCAAWNSVLNGQGLSPNTWYFGNSTEGIEFRKSDNEASVINDQAVPYSTTATAVVTDPVTGDLIFYTNGQNVYDATHQIMPLGNGLLGNPNANQGVVVAPVPQDDSLFYIFTNDANFTTGGTVRYSVVDRFASGNAIFPQPPQGNLTIRNQVLPISNASEAMIVLPKADLSGYWLLTHENGTATYNVLDINPLGFGTLTTYDFAGISPSLVAGNFSYSPTTGRIAVSPQDTSKNIQILNVDLATGDLTFDTQVFNSAVFDLDGQALYDAEWSASGDYLYISSHGGSGNVGTVLQWDYNNPLTTLEPILPATVHRSYGLQMGPDSLIYHLYQENINNPIFVGRIANSDTSAAEVIYEPTAFGTIDFVSRQFPATLPAKDAMADTLEIMYLDSCINQPTKFFANVVPRPEQYFWSFGDGNVSTAVAPINTYENPGAYTVELTTILNGQPSTTTTNVFIIQSQLQVDLGQDTVICPGETLTLDAGPGGSSYGWSTGETTQSITIDSAGFYWVVVEDPTTGCELYDAIQVDVYGEQNQVSNVWYFGNTAGIDFNEAPPVPLLDGAMNTFEGCATISDQNGDLVFYTNGQTVWNRDHNIMVNGTGLSGDSLSTQSSMIIQAPGDETIYYIFTTQQIYGTYSYEMDYSVVDIKEDQGRGGVIIKNKPLFVNSTEKLTGTSGQGPAWLIGHEYGNNTFRAYPINNDGIQEPVLSSIGSVHSFQDPAAGEGYIRLSPDGDLLAVAVPGASNIVELFEFDSVGNVLNPVQLDIPEGAPSRVYGLEFSQDSRRLYATVNGNPSKVYTWEVDSTTQGGTFTDPSHIIDSRTEIASESVEFGGIQLAPTGTIYIAVSGAGSLAAINNPGAPPAAAGYVLDGFNLGGRSSWLGLPNFIQNRSNQEQQPGASSSAPACVDSPINFSATGTSIIDEFLWNIDGQGNFATQNVDSVIYAMAGVYNAAVNITNRCVDSLGNALLDTTLTFQFEVFDNPPEPTFADQLVICGDDLLIEALPADVPGLIYDWTTGQSTRAITVTNQGFYGVTISNAGGCTSEKESLAADPFILDLGPDQTLCQATTFPILDTQVTTPGSVYNWTLNGAALPNTQTQVVDTNIPGVYEYIVSVTEAITLCTKTDTVVYTVTAQPDVNLTTLPSPGCGNDDGTIEIDIQTPSIFNYVVNGPSPQADTDIQGPTATPIVVNPLAVGTYTVRVTDLVDGCAFQATTTIVDDAALVIDSATPQTGCGDLPVDVQVSMVTDLTSLQYTFINNSDQTTIGPISPGPSNNFTTDPVPPGSYTLEVTADGCLQSQSPIDVVENPKIDANVIIDNCEDPNVAVGVTTAPVPAFSWVFGGSQISTNDTLQVTQSGTYTLIVSDQSLLLCDSTIISDITIVPVAQVDITPSGDECDGQVILNSAVNPSANYIYQWFDGGAPIPNANSPSLTVTTDGDYELTTINQSSNCDVTSNSVAVNIRDNVVVDVTSDALCDTGDPIEIVATTVVTGSNPDRPFQIDWFRNGNPIQQAMNQDTLVALEDGFFEAIVTTDENCTAMDSVRVLLVPSDVGQLPNRAIICPDDTDPDVNSIMLDPGPNFVSFTWRNSAGQVISMDPVYTAISQDTYSVDLLNGFGCPDLDSTQVVEDCIPEIYGPNAFRPGGTNSEFFLFTRYVDDFEIFIFDRWGALLFQSDSKDFRWDGTFDGALMPAGTYAYVVRYTSQYDPDTPLEFRSGVALIR